MRIIYVVLTLLTLSFSSKAQLLVINEISQGTAVKEYVEFLVVGTPTCQTPVPTADLRGIIIDDNNGEFAAGGGTGIATGAVRFANTAFWSAIPQGTLILVYNNLDINPAIPPNDVSITDGNCRLIIPINSTLFEGQVISPTASVNTYPAAGSWTSGAGLWAQIAMSNSNDSFQIRQSIASASATHVVSWGNNTLNNQIYFASAAGAVFSMMNSTNNNPSSQTNWTAGAVGTDETPGAANSTAHDAWIGAMNPQCGVSNSIQLTLTSTPTGCGATCTGTASVAISGGTPPYVTTWSNGSNATSLTNLCAGTYTVTVTDNTGCSFTDQVLVGNVVTVLNVQLSPSPETCLGACNGAITSTVTGGTGTLSYVWNTGAVTANLSNLCPGAFNLTVTDQNGCSGSSNSTVLVGNPLPNATITAAGPFTTNDTPFTFQAASLGGAWSSDCGTCMNSVTGVFNPQTAGAGNYQICYAIGSGVCAANDCVSIIVTQGCTTINNSANVTLCPSLTYNFNGTLLSSAGNYPQTFTAENGCDSIFTLNLSYFPQTVDEITQHLCLGDSVEVDGTWFSQSDIVYTPLIDGNGCPFVQKLTVLAEDCSIDEFEVFVPNAFTPNSDGTNEVFSIFITDGTLLDGFIVNRWGEIIKEFQADELSWDGKSQKGGIVQDGVYTYVLRVKKKENDFIKSVTGFVTVFR